MSAAAQAGQQTLEAASDAGRQSFGAAQKGWTDAAAAGRTRWIGAIPRCKVETGVGACLLFDQHEFGANQIAQMLEPLSGGRLLRI